MHATYRSCFLKPRRIFHLWENLIMMTRLILRLSKNTGRTRPTIISWRNRFFWLRGEEYLINSVLYWKNKSFNMVFQHVNVCTENWGVSKNSFPLIFNKEDNRAFKERWVTRLAQGVQQAGHERQKFFLKIITWIL